MKSIIYSLIGGLITLFFVYVPLSVWYNFWGGLTVGVILLIIVAAFFMNILGSFFQR